MNQAAKIAIIGGGVAGSTTALSLGQLGLNVTLFEKESSIVNGPPFCHLHAGGNLYREISNKQCITLLKQSIDFLRFYPFCVDYRPTLIAIPTTDKGDPKELLPRLKLLTQAYEALIQKDRANKVLGESREYYRLYDRQTVEKLREAMPVALPKAADEWMISATKSIDLDKVKFPLILVQEYGLNLFRLGGGVTVALNSMPNVSLQTQTIVTNIQEDQAKQEWIISYQHNNQTIQENFDFIINASGFRTGKIDDMLGVSCKRMVEFKAAYVTQWKPSNATIFPEIIFHGERGTPRGMGQFTPYQGGYFQLHGMTNEITLYNDGLVANTKTSSQPKLNQKFIDKIENSWTREEIVERTEKAIRHIAQYIPEFANAKVGSKPLFGAQQIPGNDPTLRVAEVSFPKERYARCEIVKVSSVMDMVDAIVAQLSKLGYIQATDLPIRDYTYLNNLEESKIKKYAEKLCKEREYPIELSNLTIPYRI